MIKRILHTGWTRFKTSHKFKAGVILAVVLLGVLLFKGSTKKVLASTDYFPVKRGNFTVSIVEGGTIKSVKEISIRSELEGLARIISIVPEGSFVKKGDLLVELDSADLRERINNQEVVFQNGKFAVMQAKEYLAIQKSMVDSSIKDAELKLEFAASDLEKYKEGDGPQLKNNSESKITIAKVELERARDRLTWTEKLEKKGYATRSELEADKLSVQRAQIDLDHALEDLRLLTKYEMPKKLRVLEASLEQVGKELERINLRSAAQISQVEADLNSKVTAMELQNTRLDQLKEQLKLTKIIAPDDGLVIYASSSNPGTGVLIEEGAQVRQRQDIIKLPDTSQLLIEVRVHESHVQNIKAGLPAFVTIDSFPDQQFRGIVKKVAVVPDSSSRYYNPNLKVYATEILIQDKLPDIKPGISGRAEIVITNLEDVLTVPLQAVTTVKGRQVCWIARGESSRRATVEVGRYNDKFIEIKSGLNEGDLVMLSALENADNIDMTGMLDKDESSPTNHSGSIGTNTANNVSETVKGKAAAVVKSVRPM